MQTRTRVDIGQHGNRDAWWKLFDHNTFRRLSARRHLRFSGDSGTRSAAASSDESHTDLVLPGASRWRVGAPGGSPEERSRERGGPCVATDNDSPFRNELCGRHGGRRAGLAVGDSGRRGPWSSENRGPRPGGAPAARRKVQARGHGERSQRITKRAPSPDDPVPPSDPRGRTKAIEGSLDHSYLMNARSNGTGTRGCLAGAAARTLTRGWCAVSKASPRAGGIPTEIEERTRRRNGDRLRHIV